MGNTPRGLALLPWRVPAKFDRRTLIAAGAALFIAVSLLRMADSSASDGGTLLYMIPVGVLALGFGARGGLIGAAVGFALMVAWDLSSERVSLTALGYANRALAFTAVGMLVGVFVDRQRRLESQLSRYFEQSLDLLWTADLSGRLIRVNRAWERTLGRPATAIGGCCLTELIHPDDRYAVGTEITALAEGVRAQIGMRSRCQAGDGGYVWLEWSAVVPSSEGIIHGVAHDVTAQRQAEQRLADEARRLQSRVAERTRDLSEARAETLQLLAVAGEYRDDETSQHTERVGIVAARIAKRLGLSEESVALLGEAAQLHDIGKLAIPDMVLLKPGRLTPAERRAMQTHAVLGARLLYGSRSPVLQLAGVIAESHHEWWDGSGYPKGLLGTEIPLVGRIVAVADVFDALTHERPYKPAWPVEQALGTIRAHAGSQFDPDVVDAFLAIADRLASANLLPSDPPSTSALELAIRMPERVSMSARPRLTSSRVRRGPVAAQP